MKSAQTSPQHGSPKRPDGVQLTIRPAERSDAEPLAGLMTELGYPTRVSEMEMRLETILKKSDYRAFVAVSRGEVCGMIGTCVWDSYAHNSPNGHIIALVVSGKMREHGVGKALISAAETDFAEKNIKRIAVNTRFEREDAHAFYEQLGYKKNGVRFVRELETLAD